MTAVETEVFALKIEVPALETKVSALEIEASALETEVRASKAEVSALLGDEGNGRRRRLSRGSVRRKEGY